MGRVKSWMHDDLIRENDEQALQHFYEFYSDLVDIGIDNVNRELRELYSDYLEDLY